MRYPIGSLVQIRDLTGDDQIDYYIGQVLRIIEYCESPRPCYSLVAPDGIVIIANEYELEAL